MRPDFLETFRGARVLLTGHTGFKGSWLSLWLAQLGAEVHGLSLAPQVSPSMFDLCDVASTMHSHFGDIRDFDVVRKIVADVRPDIVLHLAAQALVRQSYDDPLETVSTNIMGTAHVLEAVRAINSPCAVVVVSSDKCYENREWIWGYRENDPMGGHDPYSMSKGATELVTASWRSSFFGKGSPVRLASARAGNVIGGGDWANDRIVPDCIRAFSRGDVVELRNPNATRPWQHVLEPLGGYLLLASRLVTSADEIYTSGWNFGPHNDDVRSVGDIVRAMAGEWGDGAASTHTPGHHPKEAALLALNCDKAAAVLNWKPTWGMDALVRNTVQWYRDWLTDPTQMRSVSFGQIAAFEQAMMAQGVGTTNAG